MLRIVINLREINIRAILSLFLLCIFTGIIRESRVCVPNKLLQVFTISINGKNARTCLCIYARGY